MFIQWHISRRVSNHEGQICADRGFIFAVAPAFGDTGRQVDLDWLQTIAFATHQTDYSGTFVYQHNGHMETARITHISDQNGEYEKLENLEGPRREFIRNNNEILWYLGDHKAVQVERQYSGKVSLPCCRSNYLRLMKITLFIPPSRHASQVLTLKPSYSSLKILCAMPIKCGRIGIPACC
ncbi:MAG: hypothetical protein IPP36_12460 [Nitrosomonadales bacterium]|nr:hypothetical protein [Nitrosomonadales bacterium]